MNERKNKLMVNLGASEGGSGGGAEVIANPTLSGSEAALTGLQVGDTKYKVDEGSHLYSIIPQSGLTAFYYFTNNDNITSITTLITDLKNKGFDSNLKFAPVFTKYDYFTASNYKKVVGLYVDSQNRLKYLTENIVLTATDNVYSLSFSYPANTYNSLYQILKIY